MGKEIEVLVRWQCSHGVGTAEPCQECEGKGVIERWVPLSALPEFDRLTSGKWIIKDRR